MGLKSTIAGLAAAASLLLPAAAFAAEQSRNLDGFDEVRAAGSFDVQVTAGESFSVVVEGDEDLFDYIITEVRGDTLVVERERGDWPRRSHGRVMVRVSLPKLNALSAAGSGEVWASGVDSDSLELDLRGSGDMEISGRAGECSVDTRGSGDLEAEDLVCGPSRVRSVGSGDVKLTVNGSVEINTRGSGDIDLYGDARITSLRSRGSGDISIEN